MLRHDMIGVGTGWRGDCLANPLINAGRKSRREGQ